MKIRSLAVGLLMAAGAATAHAGIVIPDSQIEYVDSANRAWLNVGLFNFTSWIGISQVCDTTTGYCQGDLRGYSLDGWIWASSADVAEVFKEVAGSLAAPDLDALFALFECTYGYCYTPPIDNGFRFLHGVTRTLLTPSLAVSPFAGQLYNGGIVTSSHINFDVNAIGLNQPEGWWGAYFYRPVPAPTGFALVLAGALAAAASRGRNKPAKAQRPGG